MTLSTGEVAYPRTDRGHRTQQEQRKTAVAPGNQETTASSASLFDDIGHERAETLMALAIKEAIDAANTKQLPQAVCVEGTWYKRFADGSMELLEVPEK